ncbi:hypothetical protein ACE6H2_023670 [Prunus campanulata]
MTRASSLVSQIMLQIIQSPSLPLFTSLVLLVVLAIYWKRFRSHTCPIDLRLPPGPWKLPLIGNLHQLAGSLPHHCLTDLAKKYGPIMHLKLGQVSTIVISSPQLAEEVLKINKAAFSERPALIAAAIFSYNCAGLIFVPDNDHWREMRKVCMLELLSAKRVRSFASIRNEEASSLVQSISLSEGQPVNLSDLIFNMQNCIPARAALGKKCKHQQEFISLVEEMRTFVAGFDLPDLFPSLKFLRYVTGLKPAWEKLHRKMDRILEEVINDHREKRKAAFASLSNKNNKESCHQEEEEEDLVDVLLQLQESGELQIDLTSTIIKAVTLDLYFAGSETVAATTEWAMSELVRHPRAMEKAQAEVRHVVAGLGNEKKLEDEDMKKLDYLKLVIKETLRLHPPLPLIPRQLAEADDDDQSGLLFHKIGGYYIPSRSRVLINAWGIGRDPQYWENPDCFMPERFQGSRVDFRGNDFKFIPFGGGKRICPGILFGTTSVELALAQLLYHFNWKLPPHSPPAVLKNAINATKEEEQEQQQQLQLDMTESITLAAVKKNDLYVIAIPFIP